MPYLQQNDPQSTRHTLLGGRVGIGRNPDNDISLIGDMRVSRHHAEVCYRDGDWYLRDLRSRNGSYLNGKRITEGLLRAGDSIKIGGATFLFSTEGDPFATVTDNLAPGASKGEATLSAREREILTLLCRGSTDQQIADSLFISLATVRSHLDRIRDKTGRRRRPELTRLAIELGLGA